MPISSVPEGHRRTRKAANRHSKGRNRVPVIMLLMRNVLEEVVACAV